MLLKGILTWMVLSSLAAAQTWYSSTVLRNASGESREYTGVGRINAGGGCTGFFIDTRPPAAATAPAYVFTNGHCLSFLGANEVLVDIARTGTMTFNYFQDTQDRQIRFPVRRLAWGSMKGTDLAILELNSTFDEVVTAGVKPLPLSAARPAEGDPIYIVGAPSNNIPEDERFLRRASCTLGRQADIAEFSWHFWDFYRNDCPDIFGGSSGSPVLSAATGAVIAIINTTTALPANTGGGFDCYLNRPCEVTSDGFRVLEETNYAAPLGGVANCFDASGSFSLTREGCPLDQNRQLTLARNALSRATWNTTLSGSLTHYRYKVVAEGRGDCRDTAGYSGVISLAERNRIDDPIGDAEGRYYLCVLAGPGPAVDETWQPPRFASVLIARVDRTPPIERPRFTFYGDDNNWVLSFIFIPPELSNYDYKFGAPGEVRCDDPAGYRNYLRVPIRMPKRDGPYRICARGGDDSENRTAPIELLTEGPQILPFGVVHAATLEPGPLAPGVLGTVFGFNFPENATVSVNGRAAAILYAGSEQINFRVPADTPVGAATVRVHTPAGESASAAIRVEPEAPGLFAKGSAPAAYLMTAQGATPAWQCSSSDGRFCSPQPLEVGKPGETYSIDFYGSGIAAGTRVFLGPQPVEVTFAGPTAVPGVDRVSVRLPDPFGLNGYQKVELRTPSGSSSRLWLWFRNRR